MNIQEVKEEQEKVSTEIEILLKRSDTLKERLRQLEEAEKHVAPILDTLQKVGVSPEDLVQFFLQQKK